MNDLEKAEQLKQELDSLRPLDAEAEARIMQKFRLDWNYHSNKLEGNSLTFGETKALLLHGITAGTKPLKDYLEVKGHDEAIKWIEEVIKAERPLNETFICQLHTLILKEPYEIDAITPDGKPTKRLIKIGEYKSQPNHVLTQTGEMFYFAEPFETPAKMQDLIQWFREKKETDTSPILLSAEFHYKFIRIHPFDDGNGRVARILGNFILMQNGYPPVIIKTEDKQNYILALQQTDAGIFEPFFEYIANNVIQSLEIMIRGAKGENIEEPDDLDKEIALLEKRVRAVGRRIEIKRSRDVILELFINSITPLTLEFFKEFQKFDEFYVQSHARIYVDGKAVLGEQDNAPHYAKEELERRPNENIQEIIISYNHIGFNQDGFGNFNYESLIRIAFELTKYRIVGADPEFVYEKLYSDKITPEEIKSIVTDEKRLHFEFIQGRLDRIEQNK